MADTSASYNFGDIATASDAASDAASKAAVAQSTGSDAASAASDALSKIAAKVTGSGIAKITVGISAPGSPSAGDLWVDTSAALSNTISDAISKIAIVSDAASSALALASDAVSKVAVVSNAASNAQSKITARSTTWDTKTVILKVYAEATAIAAGDGAMYFTVPAALNGMNLVSCGGHLYTAATSGVVGVMIRNVTSAADMLSAAKILEWDVTEKDTATAAAASAAVINTAADNVLTGEEIAIDIDAAASGAKGLEIRLSFRA